MRRPCAVSLTFFFLLLLSKSDALALDVPVLNQLDYPAKLGTCEGCTIASDGCAVTFRSMVLQFLQFPPLSVPAAHSQTGHTQEGLARYGRSITVIQ